MKYCLHLTAFISPSVFFFFFFSWSSPPFSFQSPLSPPPPPPPYGAAVRGVCGGGPSIWPTLPLNWIKEAFCGDCALSLCLRALMRVEALLLSEADWVRRAQGGLTTAPPVSEFWYGSSSYLRKTGCRGGVLSQHHAMLLLLMLSVCLWRSSGRGR